MRGLEGVARIFACAPALLALNVIPPIVPRIPTTVTPSFMMAMLGLYHGNDGKCICVLWSTLKVAESEKRRRVLLLLVFTQPRMRCMRRTATV